MMYGKRVRNCITFKANENNFDIYQRKYMHNLRICVQGRDFSGSLGLDLSSMNTFIVTKID
jgi:hypothetical protein